MSSSDQKPARRMVRAGALLVVLCGMLVFTGTASAYWYWYTSAGLFAGVAPGDTRNSGAYLGSRGEMTNQTTGTRKTLLADALSGSDWFDTSNDEGDPRVYKKNYSRTMTAYHYCRNDSGGNVSVQCGWDT